MSSATEAKLAALYTMAQEAVYIQIILEEMGHKQQLTPIQIGNATTTKSSIVKYNQNKQKQWICDCIGLQDWEYQEKANLIGNQVNTITPTTGQSTMQQRITKRLDKNPDTTCNTQNATNRKGKRIEKIEHKALEN